MKPSSFVLWESPEPAAIAARIAVAGDFLPAGKLTFPSDFDWSEMAGWITPHLSDVDIGFANLEAVVDAEGLSPQPLAGIGEIVSGPSASLAYLQTLRFVVAGIANNHSYDFTDAGVERTKRAAAQRGLHPLGAGLDSASAPEVFVWHGPASVRVGFWAAAKAATRLATRRAAGVEPATLPRASAAIAEMQRRGARLYVALLHAGCMRTNRPDPEDVGLMDSLARCGFHIVAASHSHRVGGWKPVISPGSRIPSFCFYGLGSLVSGYAASQMEREGLIVVASLNDHGNLVRVEARPVYLDESGFAVIPGTETSDRIFERFQNLTNEIADGSFARLFYEDASNGFFRFYFRDVRAAFRQAGLRGLARKAGRVRVRHIRRLVHKVIG